MHVQSVAPVCKHYLTKALIQLPRKIEDSVIAHLNPNVIAHLNSYFKLFFAVQLSLHREISETCWFLSYGQTKEKKALNPPWIT